LAPKQRVNIRGTSSVKRTIIPSPRAINPRAAAPTRGVALRVDAGAGIRAGAGTSAHYPERAIRLLVVVMVGGGGGVEPFAGSGGGGRGRSVDEMEGTDPAY
jgi:hypothetical protein